MTAKASTKKAGAHLRRDRTSFEWAVLGTSVLTIVLVIAGLVVGGLSKESGPPKLDVSIVGSTAVPGGEALEVEVRNTGGSTAEDVLVEVLAGDLTREATLAAVPKGTSEAAVVVVPVGEGQGAEARIVSYVEG